MEILLLNGPNLQLLGTREPEIYGHETLQDIVDSVTAEGAALGCSVTAFQSNCEGELVSRIGSAKTSGFDGIILNAGAYTHTSIALHDAICAVGLPAVEVHLSNVHAREEFRRHSYIAPACAGVIAGFGKNSYLLALQALCSIISKKC